MYNDVGVEQFGVRLWWSSGLHRRGAAGVAAGGGGATFLYPRDFFPSSFRRLGRLWFQSWPIVVFFNPSLTLFMPASSTSALNSIWCFGLALFRPSSSTQALQTS